MDVVTISWGAFRCRLEGFEDPMAVLAAAAPWLSGSSPAEGSGPASSRGAPPGVRREIRNGALVLRPALAADLEAEAAAPRSENDDILRRVSRAAADADRAREADEPDLALEPTTADDLARMGLGPGETPRDETPQAPPGALDAGPRLHIVPRRPSAARSEAARSATRGKSPAWDDVVTLLEGRRPAPIAPSTVPIQPRRVVRAPVT